MLLLGVDTSGKYGSIALAQCHAGGCDILEVVPLAGGTFSAELVPQIAALLAKQNFSKLDVDGFAVATGPGSFTGLRVGLSAIKALGEVLGKPIAAVSLLEAVAAAAAGPGTVLALMDAGRKEVFAGRFELSRDGSASTIGTEELIPLEHLAPNTGEQIVTPDETLADLLRGKSHLPRIVERPRSDTIALLGWRKIQAGHTVAPDQLEANYIRRSDAEIFAKP